eukprot:g37477.t1
MAQTRHLTYSKTSFEDLMETLKTTREAELKNSKDSNSLSLCSINLRKPLEHLVLREMPSLKECCMRARQLQSQILPRSCKQDVRSKLLAGLLSKRQSRNKASPEQGRLEVEKDGDMTSTSASMFDQHTLDAEFEELHMTFVYANWGVWHQDRIQELLERGSLIIPDPHPEILRAFGCDSQYNDSDRLQVHEVSACHCHSLSLNHSCLAAIVLLSKTVAETFVGL